MYLLRKTDKEILNVVNPLIYNLIQGSTEVDHAKDMRDFSARIKNHISPRQLQIICVDYQPRWGCFTSSAFVVEAVFKEENGRVIADRVFVF